jgi:hypothetical protein
MQVTYLTIAPCISTIQYYLCEQHLMHLDIRIRPLAEQEVKTMMLQ